MKTASERFAAGLTAHMGMDPAVLGTVGTTVGVDLRRVDTRHVACYQMGGHALLPCDPQILDTVRGLESAEMSLTDADFCSWVASVGGTILGRAIMKSVGADGLQLVAPVGSVHVFDWSRPADLELMQSFVDRCDADDLDAAEVDMDSLDELAIALLDESGVIQAYASAVDFEETVPCGDIGIVTAPEVRQGGWGKAAVSALIRELLDPAGIDPLYRCDPDNAGSDRLSASLGFVLAASLTVAELPEA